MDLPKWEDTTPVLAKNQPAPAAGKGSTLPSFEETYDPEEKYGGATGALPRKRF